MRMTNTCQRCNSLSPRGHEKSELWTETHHLSLTISLLELQSTCRYCTLLKVIVDRFVPDWESLSNVIYLELRLDDYSPINLEIYASGLQNLVDKPLALLHIYLPNDTSSEDFPYLGSFGALSSRSDSPECLEFIEKRINQCTTSHDACVSNLSSSGLLPKRVLSVGRREVSSHIKLLETTGQTSKYATLSHCWGENQPIRTLKHNLEDMKKAIKWETLSKVFQNAIQVCYSLGIEYIWIDSLCIIQDDSEDWEVESSKMADYYENSFVTISATMSADGTEPFLIERDPKWSTERFKFNGTQQSTAILVRRHQGSSLYSELEDYGPLISRAWVWQETILSKRVIHYTKSELIWDCRTEVLSEDGITPCSILSMRLPQQLARCVKNPWSEWHSLLSTFTMRQLTYETDRLPALSGISSRFQPLVDSVFLAGLWKCHLPFDLCWETDHQVSPSKVLVAPSHATAPSWSWASVNGPIFLHDFDSKDSFKSICVVEDVKCSVPGKNAFGRVTDGSLRLRGPLKYLRVNQKDPKFDESSYSIDNGRGEAEPLMVDCLLTSLKGQVKRATKGDPLVSFSALVPCMLIFQVQGNNYSALHVLVLEHISNNQYTRIGVANLETIDWFEDAVETTIEVI